MTFLHIISQVHGAEQAGGWDRDYGCSISSVGENGRTYMVVWGNRYAGRGNNTAIMSAGVTGEYVRTGMWRCAPRS